METNSHKIKREHLLQGRTFISKIQSVGFLQKFFALMPTAQASLCYLKVRPSWEKLSLQKRFRGICENGLRVKICAITVIMIYANDFIDSESPKSSARPDFWWFCYGRKLEVSWNKDAFTWNVRVEVEFWGCSRSSVFSFILFVSGAGKTTKSLAQRLRDKLQHINHKRDCKHHFSQCYDDYLEARNLIL